MQAVIGGCRSCPFPSPARQKAAAAEARRDPYLDAGRERHHPGSAGNGVGRARGQVVPKPVIGTEKLGHWGGENLYHEQDEKELTVEPGDFKHI